MCGCNDMMSGICLKYPSWGLGGYQLNKIGHKLIIVDASNRYMMIHYTIF